MADRSAIQWTSATWNPVRGCSPVSAGCANCYAERMASRFSGPGQPYEGLIQATRKRWNGKVRFVPEMLGAPLRWRKPRRVFVASMSDLFHEAVREPDLDAVVSVMANTPRHTYQVLTKRPARMLEYITDWQRRTLERFPRNVWLGVSCEDQRAADERIPLLLQTPAAVRFVSLEPLLEPVDLTRWVFDRKWAINKAMRGPVALNREQAEAVIPHPIDWVIVGGESGPGARPCDVEWIRSIVRQCREVPAFVKQLGANAVDSSLRDVWADGSHHYTRAPDDPILTEAAERPGYQVTVHQLSRLLHHPKGGDPSEWEPSLRVRQFPEARR